MLTAFFSGLCTAGAVVSSLFRLAGESLHRGGRQEAQTGGGLLVAMQHRADHFETAGVKLPSWRGFQKSGCDGLLTCVCLGVAVCAQPL